MMLQVKQYNSIHAIDPDHWNSILDAEDVFHTHDFIRIVEDSKVEDATFYYLLFYDGGALVGSTVFSSFKVSLDLFITDNGLVRLIKKLSPNFFKVKILACGLPASFGQLNLKIINDGYADGVSGLIVREMKTFAKKLRITLLTVKEFSAKEEKQFSNFLVDGFFLGNSIPYMSLDIRWPDFDAYLNSLRHPYRRKILISLKKIGQSLPVIIKGCLHDDLSRAPALILSQPDEGFAANFYKMYLSVMERSTTKLEVLNENFFADLFSRKDKYQLLNFVTDRKVISSAIVFFENSTLTFMLVGREHPKDEYDSYFNLIYGIIQLAIENDCKKVKMGQTAYWVKQCVGSMPETRTIYFASTRPIVHQVLKTLRNVIFPEAKLNFIHVFKDAR
ncbi:MAG TPA: peptidogalycan biosysnthesis protein [Mucilaginibacter sp.]|jgi:predicted N-acyltransferase